MAKIYFVKSARKDNPVAKKGESYYWWKHAFGPKQYSKNSPKPSQLTNSPYLSQIYALQESIESDMFKDLKSFDDLENLRDEIANQLEDIKDECQDSFDNIPEQFQDTSQSAITLQEYIDELESSIGYIESIDIPEEPNDWTEEFEDWDSLSVEEKESHKKEWIEEKILEFTEEVRNNWPEL
jgi:hypothetical protein